MGTESHTGHSAEITPAFLRQLFLEHLLCAGGVLGIVSASLQDGLEVRTWCLHLRVVPSPDVGVCEGGIVQKPRYISSDVVIKVASVLGALSPSCCPFWITCPLGSKLSVTLWTALERAHEARN